MWKQLLLLFAIISLLGYSSCKKEDTPAPAIQVDNYIKFKANQTQVDAEFKVILNDEVFNGYFQNANALEMMRLVANGSPQGIYFKIHRIDLKNAVYPLSIKYSLVQSEPSLQVTYTTDENVLFGSNTNNPDDFTLTILSYDNQVINGTFTGTLYSGISSNPTVDIADGTFNLEIVEFD
jgi:hypothetical protein